MGLAVYDIAMSSEKSAGILAKKSKAGIASGLLQVYRAKALRMTMK